MLGRPHRFSGPYVVEKTLIGNFALECLELMVSTLIWLVAGIQCLNFDIAMSK